MTNYEQFDRGHKGLFETTLLDLIPSDQSLDAKCTSYAIFKSMQVIRKYSERLCIYANIDNLPEEILDYLAMEWRLLYYDSEFSMATKRELLKNGFHWNMIAGTVGGVEDLIQTIYKSGSVVEWYDFPSEEQVPGTFDIQINGDLISQESVEDFNRLLRKVKNVRSHLRSVIANYDTNHSYQFLGIAKLTEPIIIFNKEG